MQVSGCPYCEIWTKHKLNTKLYYPTISKLESSDFVIVDCEYSNKPVVISSEHVTSIGKEQWGRILYVCRKMFGYGMRLQISTRYIKDHWHAYITNISTDIKNLEDLRYENKD